MRIRIEWEDDRPEPYCLSVKHFDRSGSGALRGQPTIVELRPGVTHIAEIGAHDDLVLEPHLHPLPLQYHGQD